MVPLGICVYHEDVAWAEKAGCDYVELTVTHVRPEVSEVEFGRLKERLSAFRVRPEAWRRFLPSTVPVVGNEVDPVRVKDYLAVTLARIAELGGEVVVFGSPGARSVPQGFAPARAEEQLVQFLHLAADAAGQHGITVVIEPITPRNTNCLNRVAEAADLARRVNRPEVKVLADLYHMAGAGEGPEAVSAAGADLRHVHLPIPDLAGLNEPRAITDRLPAYPVDEFLRSLWAMGYRGRISIEDLDRKLMNLEREGRLVLTHVRERWAAFGG